VSAEPNALPETSAAPAAMPTDSTTEPPEAPSSEGPGPLDASSRDGPTVDAFLGAVVSDAVAPGLAPGVALGSALRWRWISLGIDARVDAPTEEAGPAVGRVSSWLLVGTLAPCTHFGPKLVPLLACAIVQAGSMQSSGSEVSAPASGSAVWLAAGARFGTGIRLSAAWELRVRGDLVFPFAPTSLWLDRAQVWKTSWAAGSLALDGVVHFR